MASWPRKSDNDAVDGKRFVALRDLRAKCIVILSPLRSGVHEVVLPAGEVLKVVSTHEDLVSCRPHRYSALEPDLVDAVTRAQAGYKGYGLIIERGAVERDCAPA